MECMGGLCHYTAFLSQRLIPMDAPEEKIRVAIRVRPIAGSSPDAQETVVPSANGQSVLVYSDRSQAASFRCGTCLNPTISQVDVFDEIGAASLVEAALDGFPVTIFAYGQTGAGKSFTIFGKEQSTRSASISASIHESDGLLPRAAHTLMEIVEQRREAIEYTVRVTCVEIYNEQVRDLFDPKRQSLQVRHAKDNAFYLENATVVQCKSASEMVRVVKLAAANRTKSAHALNDRSNRSHCLVTIYIDSMPRDASSGIKKYGKLTIVDLAGSERANDTGAVGQQLKETGHINKSLYCLSNVIQALTANAPSGKPRFVPFRDSKLTMLLIDSLGGNSKTLMLACVNGAPQFATESIRTLEFAMGVARIKNRPTAVLNPHEKLISDLKEEIRLLKLENMMLRSRTPGYFLDHPELEGGMEGPECDEAISPLGKALLSPRLRPDAVKSAEANRIRNSDGATPTSYSHSAGSAAAAGLGGIKKLALMRRRGGSPKKKQQKPASKLRKKYQKAATTPSSTTGSALPPVKQSIALFHKREGGTNQRAVLVDNKWANRSAVPTPCPNTPPPEYDDLFGIETVSVQSDSSSNQAHEPVASSLQVKGSLPALPSLQPPAATNPADEIQRLLRDMMASNKSPAFHGAPERRRQSPAAAHVALTSSASHTTLRKAPSTTQFDDARSHDLFLQLSSIK